MKNVGNLPFLGVTISRFTVAIIIVYYIIKPSYCMILKLLSSARQMQLQCSVFNVKFRQFSGKDEYSDHNHMLGEATTYFHRLFGRLENAGLENVRRPKIGGGCRTGK